MKVVAIVQARMGSTRLPGKILKLASGKTLLEHLISRLRRADSIDKIIIATTNSENDEAVCRLAKKIGVSCFRGSESDVLDRYYQAAKEFKADVVVRITGDCPLIDPDIVDRVVTQYLKFVDEFDYVSNVRPPTYPDGMDVEVFSIKTLETFWKKAGLQSEREHVTAYLTDHMRDFRVMNVTSEQDHSNLRLTVDNPEDLKLVRCIIRALFAEKKYFDLKDILSFLKTRTDLSLINSHIKRNEGLLKSIAVDSKIKS